MDLKTKAVSWWIKLEPEECEAIERKYGFYGHDIGTTESDVLYFYEEEMKAKGDKISLKVLDPFATIEENDRSDRYEEFYRSDIEEVLCVREGNWQLLVNGKYWLVEASYEELKGE